MDQFKRQMEDLSEIRSMMEQTSRFISLSGLSGVSAGIVALLGAWITYIYLESVGVYGTMKAKRIVLVDYNQLWILILIAVCIFIVAGAFATFFTVRRARKLGKAIWSPISRRVAINLLLPLMGGGLFCVIVAYHGYGRLVSGATLIFYGLALLNAGKFTFREIRYLGYTLVVLGLVATWLLDYGIIMWAVGFGLFHIIYGIVMYLKYERKG
ncbi:MAG: hypothetical protein MRZ79_00250 [Bacteroidia bacterium]|nr:hypothetical protein [Bacteroidia bacterium]